VRKWLRQVAESPDLCATETLLAVEVPACFASLSGLKFSSKTLQQKTNH